MTRRSAGTPTGPVADDPEATITARISSRAPRSPVASVAVLLWAGYVAQVLLRVFVAVGRYGPTVVADEIGYLVNARLITGGTAANMGDATFYRGGYSLLISPAYLVSDDPTTQYAIVLVINALVCGAVFPLLYHLLSGPFGVPVRPALVVSFLAALYPPLIADSALAWPEVTLATAFLAAAMAMATLVAAPPGWVALRWAVLVGVLTGYLFTTHGRTAPVVAVLVLALAVVGLARSDLRSPAAVGLACALGTLYAGRRLNAYLITRNWGAQPGEDVSKTLDRLTDPGAPGSVVAVGSGQYWYFTVGTFGIFALGVVHMCRVMWGERGSGRGGGPVGWIRARLTPKTGGGHLVAAFCLLSLVGLMVLTGINLVIASRPDHVVYGRYTGMVVPVFVALGLYRAWSVPVRRLLAEAVGAFGLVGAAYLVFRGYKDGLSGRPGVNATNVLMLPPLSGKGGLLRAPRVMALSAAGAALLVLLCWRRWARLGVLALVVVFVGTGVYDRHSFDRSTNYRYGARRENVVNVPALRETPQNIGYDMGFYESQGRYGYQWELPNAHFVVFDSTSGEPPPPVRYVISSANWPDAQRYDGTIVWADTVRDQVVWLLPANQPAPPTTSEP